jgi:AraC-like DNA-binding protein
MSMRRYHLLAKTSFELDQAPADHQGPVVVRAAEEHWAADFAVDRPSLNPVLLLLVQSGRLWQYDGSPTGQWAGPGSVALCGGGSWRWQEVRDSDGLQVVLITCTGQSAGMLVDRIIGTLPRVINQAMDCHPLFTEILAACRRAGPRVHSMTGHLVAALVDRLAELAERNEPDDSSQAAKRQFMICRQRLWQDYEQITSVTDLARRCALSPAYLSRLFRRFAGESPNDCLRRLRLRRVRELLDDSDWSIQRIADELHFADPYTMSRAFRQYYGTPPSALR